MADDDSRNEDAPERSGKSSDKDDSKADAKAEGGKSKKSGDDAASKTKTDDKKSGKDVKKSGKKEPKNPDARRGFFGRIFLFFREVVEQLRKVVYPTRKELLTYTLVVIFFVAFMLAVIFGLDQGYTKLVELVFGNTPA